MRNRSILLLTALLAAPPASAQVKVGDPAPEPDTQILFNAPPIGLSAYRGKLVLYFWFLPEDRGSRSLVEEFSRLQNRYRSEGLLVVGVTHRPPEAVERFVRRRRPSFVVACEESNLSMGAYNFQEWPSAALADPYGRVVYRGTPSRLGEGLIKKHLKGARGEGPDAPLRFPLKLPEGLARAQDAIEDGRLSSAIDQLEGALKSGSEPEQSAAREALREIRGFLERALEDALRDVKARRFHDAQTRFERIEKHAPGTPEAKRATAELLGFRKDTAILRELRGGRTLQKARDALAAGKEERARKLLEELSGPRWDETQVQVDARELLQRVSGR